MVNINTGNLGQNVYKEAVERAKDGKIDANDLDAIIKVAKQNNLSNDEKKLLTGLLDQVNVEKLKTMDSKIKPVSIDFSEPSQNATKTMEKDLELIQQGGGADAIKKLNAMSPALQEKFSYVLNNVSNKNELINLLANGTLTKLDSNSKRMIENIAEMISRPSKGTVNGKQLAEETIKIFNNRDLVTQGQHGTCGAASLENYMWSKHPAELTRIVKDLSKDGQCSLMDGSVLKAGTGSLDWHYGNKMTGGDTEDRFDFNILFQSAVMKDVALVGGDLAIGNKYIYDLADYNVRGDNGDASSVKHGDSAANPDLLEALGKSMTGTDFSMPLWGTFDKLKASANANKQPIALFSVDRFVDLHYVVVQKVDDKNVYFQNSANSPFSNGYLDSMPVDEFKKRLRTALLPQ